MGTETRKGGGKGLRGTMGRKAGPMSRLLFSNFDSLAFATFLSFPSPSGSPRKRTRRRWEWREGRARKSLLFSPPPSRFPPVLSLISVPLRIPLHLLSAFLSEAPLFFLPKPTARIPSVLLFPPWTFKFLSSLCPFWTPRPLPESGPRHLSPAAHTILPVSTLGLPLRKTLSSRCSPT